MADRPIPELGYKTPLEAAEPEHMDKLASNGVSGLLDPIAPGIAPGSDAANLSILGYDIWKIRGRGPFEAAGAGIQLEASDIAFRCNFATVDADLRMIDERAGRIREEATELAESLQDMRLRENFGIRVIFKHTVGFKGAMVLRGENLSPNVAATLPNAGERVDSVKPVDDTFEAKKTAQVVNEFIKTSHDLLNNHPVNLQRAREGRSPANVVVPWSGDQPPQLQSFDDKYGLKAACVAGASLIKGIARLTGMEVIDVKGATGDIDTDTQAKADAALQAVKKNDFVWVHVEGADEASHAGDVDGKIAIIKKIDAMVGRIAESVDLADTVVVLLADHATSLRLRRHTGDPVPMAVASREVVRDGVERYCEAAACRGGLNRVRGADVMPLVLNALGKPERLGS